MKNSSSLKILGFSCLFLMVFGCKSSQIAIKNENKNVPVSYTNSLDSSNVVSLNYKEYFADNNLIALIDTALSNNQELNIILQEIAISKNEIRTRKGEYLPFVDVSAGAGIDKQGRYTRNGAVEEQLEIAPETKFPEPFSDFIIGANTTWEIDIWKKLRNAKESAVSRYLGSIEGKNFMVTNLVAEIADAYYELLALDNHLAIIEQNIALQSNALAVVKQQKESAKVTQLAVNRFEAQLLNTQNLQYAIKQKIVETENRINFLTGRFPQAVTRSSDQFLSVKLDSIQAGIPSQLLANRPDIRQAEYELAACKLDVKVARANFYPSLRIRAGVGFQAFDPAFLFNPKSILYNLAGDLVAPLINRNGIKAAYSSSSAKQIQSVFDYQQTILNAHLDVLNYLNKLDNYAASFTTKTKEVEILNNSIEISNDLFTSARADYSEVLFTQREALEAKLDLIEIKAEQLNAKVNIYRALGGGWK